LAQLQLHRYGRQMQPWIVVAGLLLLSACLAPPGPMERLSYSAYELNNATRFGRMDVAVALVAAEAQDDFMRRHAKWGGEVRVVDVELAGLRLLTKETAEVRLAVRWHRIDESTMRVSAVSQKWMMGKDHWQLAEELRTGGSPGLFAVARQQQDEAVRAPNPRAGQL
jgi:hypothetical protein